MYCSYEHKYCVLFAFVYVWFVVVVFVLLVDKLWLFVGSCVRSVLYEIIVLFVAFTVLFVFVVLV